MAVSDANEWIGLTKETPVDARRRIVDAHHHLTFALESLGGKGSYLSEEILKDTRLAHNVTHTVFVECRTRYREHGPEALRPVGEVEFAAAQAERMQGSGTQLAGIVGYADLTLGEAVEEVLEAMEEAGRGLFRGIRYPTAHDDVFRPNPRPHLLAEKVFRRGLTTLGAREYSYDALVYHPQLIELAETARQIVGTRFVLNHLGFPLGASPYTNRDEMRVVWKQGLLKLAACPNAVVKIGGIGMDRMFGTGWSSRERPVGSDEVVKFWGDDIRWCIDTFGPSRCMFESNYPVDRGSLGYTVLWNAFQKIAAPYSDAEQDELFFQTAVRTYRLAA